MDLLIKGFEEQDNIYSICPQCRENIPQVY